MSATRMPTGRWRVTIGHHRRKYLYFDTWEEADQALRDQQWFAGWCDNQKAENQKAEKAKTEKPENRKAKNRKAKFSKMTSSEMR